MSTVTMVEAWELVCRGLWSSHGETRGCGIHTHTHTGDRNTEAMAFSHLTCLTVTIADTLLGVSGSLICQMWRFDCHDENVRRSKCQDSNNNKAETRRTTCRYLEKLLCSVTLERG